MEKADGSALTEVWRIARFEVTNATYWPRVVAGLSDQPQPVSLREVIAIPFLNSLSQFFFTFKVAFIAPRKDSRARVQR